MYDLTSSGVCVIDFRYDFFLEEIKSWEYFDLGFNYDALFLRRNSDYVTITSEDLKGMVFYVGI